MSRVLVVISGACAALALAGCSGIRRPRDRVSAISLEVVLASGIELRAVDWAISRNGIPERAGTIDISGKNARAAVLVSALPPGGGYLVRMTAAEGATSCAGEASFASVLGQLTVVSVLVQCKLPPGTGGVAVEGTFNGCPVVLSRVIGPLVTDVGKSIALRATASDPDCAATSAGVCISREAVTLAWTASAGTISPSNGGEASYTCPSGGAFDLTLTASDGRCTVSEVTQVECVSDTCGNGVTDAASGEECDGTSVPTPGQVCSPSCRLVPTCGNGIREGSEQCDPPNVGPGQASSCDALCRRITIECGDHVVHPSAGEECDPPQPGVCTSACKVVSPLCGDGLVQGAEECDDGNPTSGDGCELCRLVPTACEVCEAQAWSVSGRSACDPRSAGCTQLLGADRLACARLVECARRTGCADPDGNGRVCFCGSADLDSCLGGGANGACKGEVETAARTTSALTIAERFVDRMLPLGRAMNLLRCDAEACPGVCSAGANPGMCSSMATTVVGVSCTPVCGDGAVHLGEQCDPPSPGVCSATCLLVPRCGDGVVQAPEQCDDGNATSGDGCDPDCVARDIGCASCQYNAWTVNAQPACHPDRAGCTGLTGADRTACEAALACVRSRGCALSGDAQPCFCGSAGDVACLQGSGDGACKTEFEAAALSTDPGLVASRFSNPAYPLGRVINRIKCDLAFCSMVCPQ